jgi:hypothetical protein
VGLLLLARRGWQLRAEARLLEGPGLLLGRPLLLFLLLLLLLLSPYSILPRQALAQHHAVYTIKLLHG